MGKFRKSEHDAPVRREPKQTTPGAIPSNKVQVIDGKGRLRRTRLKRRDQRDGRSVSRSTR